MNASVAEIAEMIGGTVVGDGSVRISGLNGIKEAQSGDLAFVAHPRYGPYLSKTQASAVLISEEVFNACRHEPASAVLIQVRDADAAFTRLVEIARGQGPRRPEGVHATAVVGENVQLGRNCALGAGVVVDNNAVIGDDATVYAGGYIGHDSKIGAGTLLYPNVTVRERVRVGSRCILHSGVVLGSDGFGFTRTEGGLDKIPQVGIVVIGDDVEIGANSAVDRARFGETVIGRGTKIDNLVQIGHNVQIGEDCVISGATAIAGSAIIGNQVTIAGSVGVAGHLEIGDGAIVAGRSGVTKSIEPGEVVSGFPAISHRLEKRNQASVRRLPEALKRLGVLEKRVRELEGLLHGETKNDR